MSQRAKKIGAAFFAATALLLPFYPVLAAQVIPEIQPLNRPFGGKITKIQACQSPPGLILHIGPPSGGQYFLDPASSKVHAYGAIMPGVWTLGLAKPFAKACVGNPAGVGGFSAGGIAGQGLSSISITPLSDGYGGISSVVINGPLGSVEIAGELGQILAGLSSFLAVVQIAYAIYSLISYLKKPPTLGPAYPIIRIGTGPAPSSLPVLAPAK